MTVGELASVSETVTTANQTSADAVKCLAYVRGVADSYLALLNYSPHVPRGDFCCASRRVPPPWKLAGALVEDLRRLTPPSGDRERHEEAATNVIFLVESHLRCETFGAGIAKKKRERRAGSHRLIDRTLRAPKAILLG
jgi:hypothetical protein